MHRYFRMFSTSRGMLAALLLFTLALPAEAQSIRPPRGTADAFNPDFISRDIDVLARSVGLTETQLPVIQVLYGAYEREFERGRDAVRERIAALRPDEISSNAAQEQQRELVRVSEEIMEEARRAAERTEDPDERHRIMTEAQERLREIRERMIEFGPAAASTPEITSMMRQMEVIVAQWEREKAEMLASFLDDVRTVLDDEQLELWPVFERRLRRDRTIARGRLSAENIDLHTILLRFRLESPVRESVEAEARRYALALDAALIARNEELPALGIRLREAEEAGEDDVRQQLAQRMARLHQAVRDVNLQHAERIAALLPEEAHRTFVGVFEQLAFPATARPSRTGRIMDAAERLEGLTEAQQAEIERIVAAYRSGMTEHQKAMRAALIIGEPQAMQRMFATGAGGLADAEIIRSARAARDEFEAASLERLRVVLTAEQMERIPFAAQPAPPPRQDWGEGRPGSELTPEQRELIRRFDRDGDGRLDAQEMEALRRYLEGG